MTGHFTASPKSRWLEHDDPFMSPRRAARAATRPGAAGHCPSHTCRRSPQIAARKRTILGVNTCRALGPPPNRASLALRTDHAHRRSYLEKPREDNILEHDQGGPGAQSVEQHRCTRDHQAAASTAARSSNISSVHRAVVETYSQFRTSMQQVNRHLFGFVFIRRRSPKAFVRAECPYGCQQGQGRLV